MSARPTSNRRVVDIEDLLIWAYRDELPKRRAEESAQFEPRAVCPMFRALGVGVRVDNWSREPGMPGGEPHPDALLVETAVGSLAALREHVYDDVPPDWLASDCPGLGADQAAALARAQRTVDLLVVVSARLRRRPPFEGPPTCGPQVLANGKPAILAPELQRGATIDGGTVTHEVLAPTAPVRSGLYRNGARCPLAWSPSPQAVVEERAEYAVWRTALVWLSERLEGQLSTISVLAPSAPARPWLGERDLGKPVAIRDDGRSPVHRTARAEARRHAVAPPRRRGTRDRGRHVPREDWPRLGLGGDRAVS